VETVEAWFTFGGGVEAGNTSGDAGYTQTYGNAQAAVIQLGPESFRTAGGSEVLPTVAEVVTPRCR
jgi:hypothetical protein